jgi:hypothetical protein
MTIKTKEITVGLAQLMLDPNNYRLNKGEEDKEYSDDEIIDEQENIQQKLISENISDLETSILKNGFLEVDKIVVKELSNLTDITELKRYVVIEGNRRTAAFKSVINEYYIEDEERFDDDLPASIQEKYKSINVILVEGSDIEIKDYSQRLMGIRHVSGPRQWGGYQSAKLINDMAEQGYKKIGTLLGMRPNEAQRRHEAYLAIQQMKRKPDYTDKANPKLFTLFAEIVASNRFFKDEWLGWNSVTSEFDNEKNLHRIYDAILPNENNKQEINNPSKLRFFAKCVKTEEIRIQFENGVLLDEIDYDFDAEKRLEKIKGFISFTKKLASLSSVEYELYLKLQETINALPEPEEE